MRYCHYLNKKAGKCIEIDEISRNCTLKNKEGICTGWRARKRMKMRKI